MRYQAINPVVIPENKLRAGRTYSREILDGEAVRVEEVRQRKDGSLIDVELYGIPIIVNGSSIGMIAMYVDISERKRADEMLSTERNMLRTLIDNLPDRIYVKDNQCRFLVNKSRNFVYVFFSI